MAEENRRNGTSIWVQIAAIIVIIAGIRAAESIIVPFLVAGFLAVISFPAVDWLTSKRIPTFAAVTIVLLIAVLMLSGLGVVVSNSVQSFLGNMPRYEEQFSLQIADGRRWLESLGVQAPIPSGEDLVDPSAVVNMTGKLVAGLGLLLTNTLLILLSYVFLLLEAKGFPAKLRRAFGEHSRSMQDLNEIASKMKHYLALKALMSLATGVPVWLFLVIMDVDYPVLWGLLAFLLNFIPNIGSVIAAAPPTLLALLDHGVFPALLVAAFFILVNTVVGNILEPKMMGEGLGLSTFVVFAALVFWGWVLGTVGMFLSVPLTIMVQIILASHPETCGFAVLLGGDPNEPLPSPTPAAPDAAETTGQES